MKLLRIVIRLFVDDLALACGAVLVPALCWAAICIGLSPRAAALLLFAGLAGSLASSVLKGRDRLSQDATQDRT